MKCAIEHDLMQYARSQASAQVRELAVETLASELWYCPIGTLSERLETASRNSDTAPAERQTMARLADTVRGLPREAAEYLL